MSSLSIFLLRLFFCISRAAHGAEFGPFNQWAR
jgi:hypothetical protein